MAAKKLTERFALTVGKVDRESGTIADVLLCGTVSSNGRDYPEAVFRRDYAKYENRPVNCDHGRDATVDRRFGWFTGVKPGDDGRPRGTLHCLKSHPMYERVMEAAEKNPALFGFSHVAMCQTKYVSGREVVESIDSVESIDLVAEPATTKGLFEGNGMSLTIREMSNRLVRHPQVKTWQVRPLKWLGEMDGMEASASSMGAPPADDVDPADGVKQAFLDAALAVISTCMDKGDPSLHKACAKKITKFLAAHHEVTSDDEPEDAGAGYEDDDETVDEPAKESKQNIDPEAYQKAKILCESIGFADATNHQLVAVMNTVPTEQRAIAETLKRAAHPPERPFSVGLGRLSEDVRATPRKARKTTEGDEKPTTDPKAFARLVEASTN